MFTVGLRHHESSPSNNPLCSLSWQHLHSWNSGTYIYSDKSVRKHREFCLIWVVSKGILTEDFL